MKLIAPQYFMKTTMNYPFGWWNESSIPYLIYLNKDRGIRKLMKEGYLKCSF